MGRRPRSPNLDTIIDSCQVIVVRVGEIQIRELVRGFLKGGGGNQEKVKPSRSLARGRTREPGLEVGTLRSSTREKTKRTHHIEQRVIGRIEGGGQLVVVAGHATRKKPGAGAGGLPEPGREGKRASGS